jgi:phosphatidylserine synthase
MNVALQRRRLFIALAITALALIVALAAIVASFGFHAAWGVWLFVAAIMVGFGSHGWLILGVARERKAP